MPMMAVTSTTVVIDLALISAFAMKDMMIMAGPGGHDET